MILIIFLRDNKNLTIRDVNSHDRQQRARARENRISPSLQHPSPGVVYREIRYIRPAAQKRRPMILEKW